MREKYLDAALPLFAARGVHGTSIAQVAQALGLTKQAMLHHFASKDGLYLAVLERVALSHLDLLQGDAVTAAPAPQQLQAALDALRQSHRRDPHAARLLLRSLLDDTAHKAASDICLRQILDRLTDLALDAPRWRAAPERDARAGVLFLLGALRHHMISAPALARLYGEDVPGDVDRHFTRQIKALINSPGP